MTMATRWRGLRRPLGPKGSRPIDKSEAFCKSVANRLDTLEQSLNSKWLTFEWVSLAVNFMRSIYSDMINLVEELRNLSQNMKGAQEYWVEEYMAESMALLDVCNVLKPAVSRFEHFQMCVQLVVQASQRCTAGRQDLTAERTLVDALRSCEEELKQLVHPPLLQTAVLIVQPKRSLSSARSQKLYISKSSDRPIPREASIALGEKFTLDQASTSTIQTPAKTNNVYKKGDGLNIVMRATRETTDFISSVLVWALSDTSSHHISSTWQQNLDVFRGEESLWSPVFRRLQERLRVEIFELMREGINSERRNLFAFEELKLVEGCTLDLKAEIELFGERKRYGEIEDRHSAISMIEETTVHQLQENLGQLQGGLESVSCEVNKLFDELVRSRKKLLEAAQGPSSIHRAQTF